MYLMAVASVGMASGRCEGGGSDKEVRGNQEGEG